MKNKWTPQPIDRALWDQYMHTPKGKVCPNSGVEIPQKVAFCLWCGRWLDKNELEEMKRTKHCPSCRWMLFDLNEPGRRGSWETIRRLQNNRSHNKTF